MRRFGWVPWGLLVIVLGQGLGLLRVPLDLIGYSAVFLGLAEASRLPFVRARAAAGAGVAVALALGAAILLASGVAVVIAATLETVVVAFLIHQLCTGVLDAAPADHEVRPWAHRLRIAVVVIAAVTVVSNLVGGAGVLGVLAFVGVLGTVVIGVLTFVLLQRVARLGWFVPEPV